MKLSLLTSKNYFNNFIYYLTLSLFSSSLPACLQSTRDKARIEKIVNSMNLKISARDSRHTDARVHLFAICSQWVPLASAVLTMVVLHMPSPLQLSRERVEKLMCSSAKTFESFPPQTQLLCEGKGGQWHSEINVYSLSQIS